MKTRRRATKPNKPVTFHSEQEFLTNKQGIAYLNEKLGVPITKGAFDKFKMIPGVVPDPDCFYGNRELRRRETWNRFARGLLSSKSRDLGLHRLALSKAERERIDQQTDQPTA